MGGPWPRALCGLFLAAVLATPAALAGPSQVELTDGSVLTGDLVGYADGRYTLRSPTLGDVSLEESKVRSVRPGVPGGAGRVAMSEDHVRDQLLEARIAFHLAARPITDVLRLEHRRQIAVDVTTETLEMSHTVEDLGRNDEHLFGEHLRHVICILGKGWRRCELGGHAKPLASGHAA